MKRFTKNSFLAIFIALVLFVTACNTHVENVSTNQSLSVPQDFPNYEVVQAVTNALVIQNNQVALTDYSFLSSDQQEAFDDYLTLLNQVIADENLRIFSLHDLWLLAEEGRLGTLFSVESFAEPQVEPQQLIAFTCSVNPQQPHRSVTAWDQNIILSKLSATCQSSLNYSSSVTMDVQVQRQQGWGIFSSWSTVAARQHTRNIPAGGSATWSPSTAQAQTTCINGTYRTFVRASAPGTIGVFTTRASAARDITNCN
jgi:hypothetical protein